MPDSRGLGFHGITPVYRRTEVPASPSRSRAVRLPVPTNDAMYHTYRSDLSEVRALVLERAREAGLAEGRASDLVLAVSEVAANTLRHTKSSGTLAIWHNEREIVCEIRDEGTIDDPLAGQVRPAPDAMGGHGLWLVYQVCDFVELNSDASGTTIRMHMALPASNGGR
jgi:anti-sigma regulatory factor (Ser/Thr protein kinase)